MLVAIYHSEVRGQRFSCNPDYWANQKDGDFRFVALVDVDTIGQVFQASNHIDSCWLDNPEVKYYPTRDRVRSTSVGDVYVVMDGPEGLISYMVDSVGLLKL